MATRIGVMKESASGERRVAMVPEVAPRIASLGGEVLVERDAGAAAFLPDSVYVQTGAVLVDASELDARADVLVCVQPPSAQRIEQLQRSASSPNRLLIGMLNPVGQPDVVAACAGRGVSAISLDLLPRTLSRAQSMDALTSQATMAGYKAALVAANAYGRYFPMLMTAAGTAKPAQVLVLGAGVAGLSAMGACRRLGALVTGYDIRPETREEVRSTGARFLDLAGVAVADGVGGYARALTDEERQAQQAALQQRIGEFDVVITTAQVPGRRPPRLVTAEAIKGMRAGSVVVDLAASPLGGNVEGAQPDAEVLLADGVRVIGAGNLASTMAPGASAAYARNIAALLAHLMRDGVPVIDPTDEIVGPMLVAHEGKVLVK